LDHLLLLVLLNLWLSAEDGGCNLELAWDAMIRRSSCKEPSIAIVIVIDEFILWERNEIIEMTSYKPCPFWKRSTETADPKWRTSGCLEYAMIWIIDEYFLHRNRTPQLHHRSVGFHYLYPTTMTVDDSSQ
jgi:hypothetical protein